MSNTQEQGADPKINFEHMAQEWQNAMIDNWSSMTKQFVASDAFASASSAYMDWALAAQKQIRNNSSQFMEALDFPKRSDLARLSKQVASLEGRLADSEETQDAILAVLKRLESKLDNMSKASSAPSAAPTPTPTPTSATAGEPVRAVAAKKTATAPKATAVRKSKKS